MGVSADVCVCCCYCVVFSVLPADEPRGEHRCASLVSLLRVCIIVCEL